MWTDPDDMDQPEPEPDYDNMSDADFEAHLARNRERTARRWKFYMQLSHDIRKAGKVIASFKVEDGKVTEVTHV